MNIKKYQNEIVVLVSLLFMISTYMYKSSHLSSSIESKQEVKNSSDNIKEVISLKNIWSNKNIDKKVSKLKSIVPSSKVNWSKKGKKLTVNFKDLNSKELNKLMTKILNLPVEIKILNMRQVSSLYSLEFKCKW